ncbi:MAG: 6-phosphogluconolactonase [Verrucomicrobia bacterium]|nr:6-phosphogluconolactonase [Verrucomicrobiota bacterium]
MNPSIVTTNSSSSRLNNDPAARRVQVLPDAAAVARAAAEEFVRLGIAAARARGQFTVALAGGSTPKALYELLATEPAFRDRVPWAQTHLFFGDERHVAPDHKDSNYRMAREAMLERLAPSPLPAENVRRIPSENPDAYAAAAEYEATLRAFFHDNDDAQPRFDLVLLGMGPDGHTASLFPGTTGLRERDKLVCAAWVDKFSTYRITFTPPLLCAAAAILYMVTKEDKADTLRAVLHGPGETDRYPSQGICTSAAGSETLWLADRAAAAKLPTNNGG